MFKQIMSVGTKKNVTKYTHTLKELTESLDICILKIGPFSWIVLSKLKFSNDQRQIVVSRLDETSTSLAVLT